MRHGPFLPCAAVWLGCLWLLPAGMTGAEVRVRIVDRDGAPVPEIAVYAEAAEGRTEPVSASLPAPSITINQRDLAFDPHLSVVRTGTLIRFPNHDDVRHHVYSFSRAKRINLTIDSGSMHEQPLVFDASGIVTLGCNIHDDMLAYVLIVDTPHFAMTDADGVAVLDIEPGRYRIASWTPRLPPKSVPAPRTLELAAGEVLEIVQAFEAKLYPPHQHSETSLHWETY